MKRKRKHDSAFWVMLTPVLLALLVVIIIPFVFGIYYSFTNWSAAAGENTLQFVGFENYKKSLEDPRFLYSFGVTLVYTVACVVAMNVVAFLLALLVSNNLRGKNIYRAGFFLPNLIGGLVLGYVWQFLFNAGVTYR